MAYFVNKNTHFSVHTPPFSCYKFVIFLCPNSDPSYNQTEIWEEVVPTHPLKIKRARI